MVYVPPSPPPPPPKCPHCKAELPGWSEPSNTSATIIGDFFVVGAALVAFIFLIVQLIAFGAGACDAKEYWNGYTGDRYNTCQEWPSIRAELLVPAWPVGCYIGVYLKHPVKGGK